MFLEVSQNLQENTCARDSSLIKLACNFIKKESLAQAFSCEFCEISITPFLQNTSGQLLQNGHAKILITHILYRRTTPEAYLEHPVAHLQWSLFAKRSRQQFFQKLSTPDACLSSKYPSEFWKTSPRMGIHDKIFNDLTLSFKFKYSGNLW